LFSTGAANNKELDKSTMSVARTTLLFTRFSLLSFVVAVWRRAAQALRGRSANNYC
jgi:hypothetical protein